MMMMMTMMMVVGVVGMVGVKMRVRGSVRVMMMMMI